ncbi:MAG: cache domain-containing protein, partial [Ruminococcus sp.]|nr:cache domain-containing protein [Ruminococcus sp.]
MKSNPRPILIIIIIAALLIAANIAEIALVFGVTSTQTKQSGADRLEVIGGELEETINDAKLSVMRYAIEVQPLIGNRAGCESFIRQKKTEMAAATDSVCFNVYLATDDWYYIPDFEQPEGYEIEKRSWYTGALRQQGEPFVTDPYVDAMTGSICFSVSVMLDDGKGIACMDYTMENIQQHIKQMNEKGTQQAVIVTEEGIIAGCSDEELVGKGLIQNLPDYAGIFSLVKNSDSTVSINQRGENLFAVHSGFGWYLIVSENNWSLYKTSYIEMLVMLLISLAIFGVVLALYLRTSRNAKRAQELLHDEREFIRSISSDLREPADRINSGASIENVKNSTDYEQEFVSIREAGARLSDMLTKLHSYSELADTREKEQLRKKKRPRELTVSRHFRSIILSALLLVMAISVYININASLRYGTGQMQKAVSTYEFQLSEWINTQKSILDMFCSTISTNPEMLEDYDGAVEYLDRITKQYPEISVSYMTNPDFEHTVIMNNGWEPDDDWKVEERGWYKELMASEKNWVISSPYYDEQTGLYCVTFAEKVYDDRTGEFLGNFGIDFYMDKLVDILGSSYTDSSYAFLADAKGEIINHPYGKYQMSESGSQSIIELPYNSAEPNGKNVRFIKDHDGRLKAVIATRN